MLLSLLEPGGDLPLRLLWEGVLPETCSVRGAARDSAHRQKFGGGRELIAPGHSTLCGWMLAQYDGGRTKPSGGLRA